ncbi:hypothetical protein GO011_14670 [Mycobacterium sp. 20091114027_K0903767]|nr:hypothetical protein [Mycobacterium sp. 20091114027_K0903767]
MQHTAFCEGNGRPCEDDTTANNFFNQPPGFAVTEARDEFDEDTPWCVIHARAVEIAKRDNGEDEPATKKKRNYGRVTQADVDEYAKRAADGAEPATKHTGESGTDTPM